MRIYVGNMSFKTSEETLRNLFSEHGEVAEAAIVIDRNTGRHRGFGFVTMNDDDEGRAAINALNGVEIDGRKINVNEARPRANAGGGGGGRGGYGGGNRGGYGNRRDW